MHKSEFVWEYGGWIIAFVCFCFAFSGIFAKSIPWFPARLFTFSRPEEYLLGHLAITVGILYLVVGIAALFSTYMGVVGFSVVLLLTWFLGNFVRQRSDK